MDSELESFFTKFRSLLNSGYDAHLEVNSHAGQAWVSLRVRQGHAPGPVQPPNHFAHHNKTRNGPSRQQRRERRAEQRRLAAEEAVPVDKPVMVDGEYAEDRQVEVSTADKADSALSNSDAAVEVIDIVNVSVEDEICPNAEYLSKLEDKVKVKCSIQLVPENPCNIDLFRDKVEEYFTQKKDIIENVVICKVEHSGKVVRLMSIVKRQLWINYFSEPEASYGDLPGVKKAVHDCREFAN